MPGFAPSSSHIATVTVNNSGGAAQVMVRGQVQGSTDGSNVVDSAATPIAAAGSAAVQLSGFTMPGTPGNYQFTVEVYWRYADGSGTWTQVIGPVAAGEGITIASPAPPPPKLSIAGVTWS